ncbi:hypothetical protein [Xenorhabdus bovienii]|nr:hypothetical protein [Xenorhabdus bovienii]MDE9536976.1 hypothetical protein [Xenorhabdus bovienii]MDE9589975.1 hypothetical protein [Xenorhabdus bovienii]
MLFFYMIAYSIEKEKEDVKMEKECEVKQSEPNDINKDNKFYCSEYK